MDQEDWGEASRNVCIEENLHEPIEVVEEDSDDGDDDESMMEKIPDFRISSREALVEFGKIMCTTDIDAEDSESPWRYNTIFPWNLLVNLVNNWYSSSSVRKSKLLSQVSFLRKKYSVFIENLLFYFCHKPQQKFWKHLKARTQSARRKISRILLENTAVFKPNATIGLGDINENKH